MPAANGAYMVDTNIPSAKPAPPIVGSAKKGTVKKSDKKSVNGIMLRTITIEVTNFFEVSKRGFLPKTGKTTTRLTTKTFSNGLMKKPLGAIMPVE